MHIDHWHVCIEGRNIPAFDTRGLSMWLSMQLFSNPEEAGRRLDYMLNNPGQPLLDHETGLPYVYRSLPKEVLSEPNASVKAVKDEADQEWVQVRADMLKHLEEEYKVGGSLATMHPMMNKPPKEGCAGHTNCSGQKQPVVVDNSQAALSSGTA
jgi:hypothetical protein